MTLQLPTEFAAGAWPIQLVKGADGDAYNRRKYVATRDIANNEKLLEEQPLLGVSALAHQTSPLTGQFTLFEALSMGFATNFKDAGVCGWTMVLVEYVIAHRPGWLTDTAWMDQFDTSVAETAFARTIDTECDQRLRRAMGTANARRSKLSSKAGYQAARRFARLLANNSFSVENDLTTKQVGEALYHWTSFFNHSCAPNARWRIGVQQKITLYANEPIAAGTEVTISYGCDDPLYEPNVNSLGLQRFACQCTMCTRAPDPARKMPTLSVLFTVADVSLAGYFPLLNDPPVEDLPIVVGGAYHILRDVGFVKHMCAHPIETAHVHGFFLRVLTKYYNHYRVDMQFVNTVRQLNKLVQACVRASEQCELTTTHVRRRALELKAMAGLLRILDVVYNAVDKDVMETEKRVSFMQNLFPKMHEILVKLIGETHSIGDVVCATATVDEALGEFGMGKDNEALHGTQAGSE